MTQPPPPSTPQRPLPTDAHMTGGDDDWNRLHSMLLEVPGGEWTVAGGAKLSGVDPSVCHAIFAAMADSGFLARRSNGTFVRASMAPRGQSGRMQGPAPHHVRTETTVAGAVPGDAGDICDTARMPLERIRREYVEMPGLRLTQKQAQRLCGMDAAAVEPAIHRLLAERFLCRTSGGAYAREKRRWPRPTPVFAKATLAANKGRQSA